MARGIGTLLLVGAAAALGLSGPGLERAPARVVLFEVRVADDLATADPGLARALTALLTAELANRLPLVPAPEVASAARTLGITTAEAAADPAVGRRLGEFVGAGHLLTVRAATGAEGISLAAESTLVPAGTRETTFQTVAKDVASLPEAAERLAAEIGFAADSREPGGR